MLHNAQSELQSISVPTRTVLRVWSHVPYLPGFEAIGGLQVEGAGYPKMRSGTIAVTVGPLSLDCVS